MPQAVRKRMCSARSSELPAPRLWLASSSPASPSSSRSAFALSALSDNFAGLALAFLLALMAPLTISPVPKPKICRHLEGPEIRCLL